MTTADLAPFSPPATNLDDFLPAWTQSLGDLQTAIPDLAKDGKRLAELDCVIGEIPTLHRSVHGDARLLSGIEPNSVHLVLTSPPYWTLKEYRDSEGQMGHFEDYAHFLTELDRVWTRFPGLARRRLQPLHADETALDMRSTTITYPLRVVEYQTRRTTFCLTLSWRRSTHAERPSH